VCVWLCGQIKAGRGETKPGSKSQDEWVWVGMGVDRQQVEEMKRTGKRRNFSKSYEQSSGLMYLLTGRAGQGSAGLGPRNDFWPFLGVGMAPLDRPPRVEWRLIAK